jgi:hypothetical protein
MRLEQKLQSTGRWLRGQPALPSRHQDAFRCRAMDELAGTVFWPALRPLFIQLIRTQPAKREAAALVEMSQREHGTGAHIRDGRVLGETLESGACSTSVGEEVTATARATRTISAYPRPPGYAAVDRLGRLGARRNPGLDARA